MYRYLVGQRVLGWLPHGAILGVTLGVGAREGLY